MNGGNHVPRTWPEHSSPTAEQLFDWIRAHREGIDLTERPLEVLRNLLAFAERGGRCFEMNHDGWQHEAANARQAVLTYIHTAGRYRHAWLSARRRAKAGRPRPAHYDQLRALGRALVPWTTGYGQVQVDADERERFLSELLDALDLVEPAPEARGEVARFFVPYPCPECTSGKHDNCDTTTWDELADAPTVCPCHAVSHAPLP